MKEKSDLKVKRDDKVEKNIQGHCNLYLLKQL